MQYPLLFESPHWFREAVATLGIFVTSIGVSMFWLGFYGVLLGIGLTIIVIWLLHKRAMRIRGSRQASA